ncbi:MAG: adenylate/guanylate cyclase domain-containing protein [Candidatus Kapaibacterium sp.]
MTPEELTTAVEELEALVQTGNDYAQVKTQARLLLTETGIENEPELHCKVLLALSLSLVQRGFSKKALPFAEEGLSIAQDNCLKHFEARALAAIGNIYEILSDYPRSLKYFGMALELNEELDSKEDIAINLRNCGIIYGNLSDYPNALKYFTKSLVLYEELGIKDGIVRNLSNISEGYRLLSDYPKALEFSRKALSLNEQLGNKSGIARNLGNCGMVFEYLSDYPTALEYYGKALALFEELGIQDGIAQYLTSIGEVYRLLSDYPKALEHYGKSLALAEELGSKVGIAINLQNIGLVHQDLSDYPKALEHYGKSLAFAEELGSKYGIAINLGNCGIVYGKEEFEGHDSVKAEEYLLKAMTINEEIGAKQNLYENHKGLAELYERQERWKEHSLHYKKYHELKEEVKSEEAKKKAEQLDYERKNAEREKQLAIERSRAQEREHILNNILPEHITTRLINGENPIADHFDCVSILFMDIVDFTVLSSTISAQQLVHLLNSIFKSADGVTREFGLEKIKTIGDAYMAVAGAPTPQDDHATRAAQAALALMDALKNLVIEFPETLGDRSWINSIPEIQVRIGLHCGSVAAGVVGENKFLYDLWGDAVNTAARMESHGEAGKIHVSEAFVQALNRPSDTFSHWEKEGMRAIPRDEMEIKGKGMMRTFFLERA